MFFVQALRGLWPHYFKGTKVCEVGSLNINGTVRVFFESCDYLGYDVEHGPDVDIAQEGQLIGEPTGSVDVVVSTECFEHNPFWAETLANMLRICRPEGLVVVTCATSGRPEHGTTRTTPGDSPLTVGLGWNYYRNLSAEDFAGASNLHGWFQTFHFYVCPATYDLYFFGLRRGNPIAEMQRSVRSLDELLLHNLGAYKVMGYFEPSVAQAG
jgi:SAM-dependent methyltransferase